MDFPRPSVPTVRLKCINVNKINYIKWFNVACKTREEARALRAPIRLGVKSDARQQAVRWLPTSVVGEGTKGLNKPTTPCNFLTGLAQQTCLRLREGYHGWLESLNRCTQRTRESSWRLWSLWGNSGKTYARVRFSLF